MPKAENDNSRTDANSVAKPAAGATGAARARKEGIKAAGPAKAVAKPKSGATAPARAAAKPKPGSGTAAKTAVKAVENAAPAGAAETAVVVASPAGSLESTSAEVTGGGEENPLHKKLRLRSEDTGVVIAPPPGDDNPLLPLPVGFLVLDQAGDLAAHEGQFDYIHVFARDRAELIDSFTLLRDKLAPGGGLWVSWLKQSSTHRGGGQQGDLNENVVRRLGLTHALVDVKVAALDRDWSALKLVHRKR